LAVKECVRLLSGQRLTLETAENFLSLSSVLGCEELVNMAERYIVDTFRDFEALWTTSQFLSLSPRVVEIVLASDEIIANSENTGNHRLLRW
jgi:hypothetical protein